MKKKVLILSGSPRKDGNSDLLCKHADGLRSVTTAADTADGRHTRVVPAAYEIILYKFEKFTLAHHCVCKIQAGKLILM